MGLAQMVASFVGGLGFFLLGMGMLTDGLKVAAGGALERTLRRSTQTRARALAAGLTMTALVQSSSAVTVATLGFVNAGLLDLSAALWVIFGSNVGTTVTGWLVNLTGLDIDLEALALPLVGVGTLLHASGPRQRRGAIGQAVTGLGLFFVGLGVLSETFGTLALEADLARFHAQGFAGWLAFLGVGTLIAVAVQSSSATVALAITGAATGALALTDAAAMVIGANLGTTSTAVFAAVKATPAAKRTAVAHVLFNLVAAGAALALWPLLLHLLEEGPARRSPPVTLAVFHTAFNVLGVVLMWPLAGPLARLLRRRFVTEEEEEGQPRYLDATVLQVPRVGLRALGREALRLNDLAGRILEHALAGRRAQQETLQGAFDRLLGAIASCVDQLDRAQLPADVAVGLRQLMRATRHYVVVTEQAREVDPSLDAPVAEAALQIIAHLRSDVFDVDAAGEAFGVLQERFERCREEILEAVAAGTVSTRELVRRQRLLTEARRAAKHLVRGARELEPLVKIEEASVSEG